MIAQSLPPGKLILKRQALQLAAASAHRFLSKQGANK
jgi:hypothetical protein